MHGGWGETGPWSPSASPVRGPNCTRLAPGQAGWGSAQLLTQAVGASDGPSHGEETSFPASRGRRGPRGRGSPLLLAPFSLSGPIDYPLGRLTTLYEYMLFSVWKAESHAFETDYGLLK